MTVGKLNKEFGILSNSFFIVRNIYPHGKFQVCNIESLSTVT